MQLPFAELRAAYRVERPFRLPDHSGSLLRGVLGRALRGAACIASMPCSEACQNPGACAYARLFDPPVPAPPPHRFLRSATRAPQPLVPIFPPPGARALAAGDPFEIGLRVLGPFPPDDAERLRGALEQVCALPVGAGEGRLALEAITQVGPRRQLVDVRPGGDGDARVTLRTATPLWLDHRGKLLAPEHVDFSTLFRHVYRRLTTLAALYGTPDPDDDRAFDALDARARDVRTRDRQLRALRWQRWSVEKDVRHPMRGLVGSLVFEGPLMPFLPVLRAALIVHAGKGTSHGLGRLALEAPP